MYCSRLDCNVISSACLINHLCNPYILEMSAYWCLLYTVWIHKYFHILKFRNFETPEPVKLSKGQFLRLWNHPDLISCEIWLAENIGNLHTVLYKHVLVYEKKLIPAALEGQYRRSLSRLMTADGWHHQKWGQIFEAAHMPKSDLISFKYVNCLLGKW